MDETLELLAIFPHPDDETLGMGPTLAHYAAQGVETYLICATRGERGWSETNGANPGLEAVGRLREAELQCAARHLGLHEVRFLDYIDGDLDRAEPSDIHAKIAGHIRRIRPQVVVTFPPDGIYGHPDHIALSQFTQGALVCAADAAHEDDQAPHRVPKLYYLVDSAEVVSILQQAFGGIRMEVDGVMRTHIGWQDWQITTRIDCCHTMAQVRDAIHCHKSQLSGFGTLPEWSLEELARIYGVGTFFRVYSLANGGREAEADLFEGLQQTANL